MVNSKGVRLDLARQAGLSTERFPENNLEACIAETALASELDKLTTEDCEKPLFEIHGISAIPDEDPQMVAKALHDLQQELDKIPEKNKDAFEQAKFLNPAYVNDRKFRLMFLRCHEFDPVTTAKTITFHFEVKRELFGDGEILARDVRQSDLSPKAIEYLEAGLYQMLPQRDASGRGVLFINFDGLCGNIGNEDTTEEEETDVARATWYHGMTSLDEESQKHGVVWCCMFYQEGGLEKFDLEVFEEFNKLDVAVPSRNVGCHFCFLTNAESEESIRYFMKGVALFSETEEVLKMKTHFGTHEEIQFKLQTFGIPMEDCPVQADGTWENTFNLEWLTGLRKQEEKAQGGKVGEGEIKDTKKKASTTSKSVPDTSTSAASSTAATTMIPKKCDVLFGKNARARDHAGNVRAHLLVDENFEAYEAGDKAKKTDISNQIIASIKSAGGRFLKQSPDGGWEEVEDKVARQKIAHWCRHLRHKTSKNKDKAAAAPPAGAINAPTKRTTRPPQEVDEEEAHSGKKAASSCEQTFLQGRKD